MLRIVIDARRLKDFGIGTYIRNLTASLGKLDQENHYRLVVNQQDIHEISGLPSNFEKVVYTTKPGQLNKQITFPLFLKTQPADLYHMPLNVVPLMMPRPYVVTVHDMSSLLFEKREGIRNTLRLFQYRRGLLRAAKIIAVSAATRRDIEHLLGIPTERIRQIYNGPDPKFTEHRPAADARASGPDADQMERRRILERYQITYPFLLYAGTIRPQKNIPRLVEAFAVLKGELENHPAYRDLRLVIIGDDIAHNPSVRRAVIQAGVEQVVRFLGFVPADTLRVFFEAASAFVFPSLYEGFGLPPLEAMATGTPVVTSSVSSLPEVVGDAAMIVNPENVFDISRGIREVLLDEELRNRLVRKGYEQLRRFSWDRTASEVLETYGEVARSLRLGR
jgi:glycosyltransferase involved in cell wall biosynthesis